MRCFLTALSGRARRPITIGDPNCALLLPDEAAMLLVLTRAAVRGERARVAAAIDALARDGGERCLLPLARALAALLG